MGKGRRKGWESDRVRGSVGRREARVKRIAAETKGGMGHGGVKGRGRERNDEKMKGPTGTEHRRGPAWTRQSLVSL